MPDSRSQSAASLSWFALMLNVIGLAIPALGVQFLISGFAALLAFIAVPLGLRTRRVLPAIALLVSLAGAIAAYPEYKVASTQYAGRVRVDDALHALGKARTAIEAACKDGTLEAKRELADLGLARSQPQAAISRAQFDRISPEVIRVKATLTPLQGSAWFGLRRWATIPEGSTLEIEYRCTPDKTVEERLVSTTLKPMFLPSRFR